VAVAEAGGSEMRLADGLPRAIVIVAVSLAAAGCGTLAPPGPREVGSADRFEAMHLVV